MSIPTVVARPRPRMQNPGGPIDESSGSPQSGSTSAPARHGARDPLPPSQIPELVRAASTQPAPAAPPSTEWPPSCPPSEQFPRVSGPPRALRHGEGSRHRTDAVIGVGNSSLSAGTVVLDLGRDTTPPTRTGSDEAPVSPEQIERTRGGINGWFVAILLGLAAGAAAYVVRQEVAADLQTVLSGEAGFSFSGRCVDRNLQGILVGNGTQVHIQIDVSAGEGAASMPSLKAIPFTQAAIVQEDVIELVRKLKMEGCEF